MKFFYDKLLTQETCRSLVSEFNDSYYTGKLPVTTGIYFATNSHGWYDQPGTIALVPYLTQIIQRDYGHLGKIVFKNSYNRLYKKDSILRVHVDRPGLDITLSVCLKDDSNLRWPLFTTDHEWVPAWLENFMDEPDPHYQRTGWVTEVGQGVCMLGTKTPHWRPQLQCEHRQFVVQCFWHWTLLTE